MFMAENKVNTSYKSYHGSKPKPIGITLSIPVMIYKEFNILHPTSLNKFKI